MKYLFIIVILLLTADIFAQDVPSGYTTNLRLRKYDLDDYPSADSLNKNLDDIDAGYTANRDSINAVKADVYTTLNYSGNLKNSVVGNSNLKTEVDTSRLKTTGTDNLYGLYNFYGGYQRFKTIYPIITDQYYNGYYGVRWLWTEAKYVCAEQFVLRNPTDPENDSSGWVYDGSKITTIGDKPVEVNDLNIKETFTMDSAASVQTLKLVPNSYTIPEESDSVIVLDSLLSNCLLFLPATIDKPGIETINMTGAAVGTILILYTTDATDSILIRETQTDGNIKNKSDFYLTSGDNIGFMYIYDQPALAYYWIVLWKQDND